MHTCKRERDFSLCSFFSVPAGLLERFRNYVLREHRDAVSRQRLADQRKTLRGGRRAVSDVSHLASTTASLLMFISLGGSGHMVY